MSWVYGECPVCGELLKRRAPADVAVCVGNPHNSHPIVEVPLSFVVPISDELYNKIENAFSVKTIKSMINPVSVKEFTNTLINELLVCALNDDALLSNALIELGKTPEEARMIIGKLREEK